jgi:RNA-directed DNA polymerase
MAVDPHFSQDSYVFNRTVKAHQAVRKGEKDLKEGYHFAVDRNPERFFDLVDQDILMDRVSRRVSDKALW